MKRQLFWALAASCAACTTQGGDPTDDDDGKFDGPVELPACIDVTTSCPTDLPELGAAGGFADDVVDITWKHCGGNVSFAPMIYRRVPADMISMAITIDGGQKRTGFALLNLGTKTLISQAKWNTAPFFHDPLTNPAATIALPIDPQTTPTGPHCLALLPIAGGKLAGQSAKVHFLSRRDLADGDNAIDINIITVEGAKITSSELTAVTTEIRTIYQEGGAAQLGQVRTGKTNVVSPHIKTTGRDINTLRAFQPSGVPARSINVFLIQDFSDDPETLGFAAGMPGPIALHGTAGSGVVLAVASHRNEDGSLDSQMLGSTIAHEVGHQIGLFHTTEADGGHDALSDTPDCPLDNDADGDGSLSAEECKDFDANHMMFWISGEVGPQRTISSQQADVFRNSPVAYPLGGQ